MENTLPSFLRAVALGATAVELDVHVTADGVPVVHHDPELSSKVRPSNFARAKIAELDSRDLLAVTLSSGDRIPTLVEVLEALTPATKVYVEIKGRCSRDDCQSRGPIHRIHCRAQLRSRVDRGDGPHRAGDPPRNPHREID